MSTEKRAEAPEPERYKLARWRGRLLWTHTCGAVDIGDLAGESDCDQCGVDGEWRPLYVRTSEEAAK